MLYLSLFWTFFKIGLFGFGGGYAMLSLIQGEVVTAHRWLTSQQFTDIVVWGSVVATFAVCLPSFILMLTISKFFLKYQHHPLVESVFKGLRPAVIGLLAAAALLLMNVENFGDPVADKYQFITSCLLFLVAFVATSRFKANPILMIIVCGLIGLAVY